MSKSKFIMAQKLARVQEDLMGETIQDYSLEFLLPLIFKACLKENLTFWFNFLENECVLNLRDIGHENYELNIRQYYTSEDIDSIKIQVLKNTFLLTDNSYRLKNDNASSAKKGDEPVDIISGDKPVPKHIRTAIETIKAKGIPVTPDAINNHLPTGQMSPSQLIECNRYLKQMKEASQ